MKKWIISLSVLIILFFAAVYIFIPRILPLSAVVNAHCSSTAAYRLLSDESQWYRWWPLSNTRGTCKLTKKMYNRLAIDINYQNMYAGSHLNIFPLSPDSLVLQWQCSLSTGDNPFTKIAQYKKAVALKKNMSAMLQQLGAFLASNKNVYGYTIQRTTVTDTLLVAIKSILPAYPTTPDIYRLISTLNSYIASQGASQTGAPIMNVTRLDDHRFQLMVAIPTNRPLPGNKDIFFRKMVPGAFMMANVTGGDYSVVHALQQMQLYFDDYKKTAMAIPFAALITNRVHEPDTNRWITRVYAPVY